MVAAHLMLSAWLFGHGCGRACAKDDGGDKSECAKDDDAALEYGPHPSKSMRA